MSFFGQTQRKTNLQKAGVPSPGDYDPKNLSNSRKYSYAPFGSTERLNRSNYKQNPAEKKQKFEDEFSNLKDLKDCNFKVKTQEQISSMFKSETYRFGNENVQEKPGPGQYNVAKQSIAKAESHKVFTKDYHLNIKPSVPSIPVDNLGFKEDENNEMKKVEAPKSITPDPGSYQVQLQPNSKGVLAWKAGKMVNRMSDNIPGPGQYNYQVKSNKSLSSCFTSTTDRFGIVKKLKHDKIPGPGAYDVDAMKKQSHNISNEAFFNSKRSRFENVSHNTSIGPGSYFDQKKKSHSLRQIRRVVDRQPEMVKTIKKSSIFEQTNKNPGPGQYKTNFGISYQMHKALLRKQATDVLPKQKRKVFQPKLDQQIPGPGAYEAPSKTQEKKSKGKLWKKVEVVNLKQQPEVTPSPMDYNNLQHTIQAKIKQMNSKLTLTQQKPFNSGTQRFKHYKVRREQPQQEMQTQKMESEETEADLGKYHQKKKVKRLVMTTIKVRVPFGISSSKFQQKSDNYNGPDFYNNSKDWVKPSFNIKSRLQ